MFFNVICFVVGVFISQEYKSSVPSVKETVIYIYEKLSQDKNVKINKYENQYNDIHKDIDMN